MDNASTSGFPGWRTLRPVAEPLDLTSGSASFPGADLRAAMGQLRVRFTHRVPLEARVLIDPVGDLLSFYEFRSRDGGQSAIWRASRSGHRIDSRWSSEAIFSMEDGLLQLTVPFQSVPPAAGAPGEQCKLALQILPQGDDPALRPPTRDADFFIVLL